MIDGEDLALFERSLRHAVTAAAAAASDGGTAVALDAALVDLGWRDALSVDPRAAVSVLFELQGGANAASSALDQVLADALDLEAATPLAVVLPGLGSWDPPGALGDRLVVRGLCTAALGEGRLAVVVAASGETQVAVQVPVASLTRRTVEGIDPSLGLFEVSGDVAVADLTELGPVDWGATVRMGQLAMGHELVGASRRMLDLAREHALDRIQFGRPIAMFQAVRHRLAETLVAVEAADAALDAAWLDGGSVAAAMAKATAGRGARVAARHCQQVLAGIGFTTEHPFHRYVRRALVLDQLLGSTHTLTRHLGHEILARRTLPTLLPL